MHPPSNHNINDVLPRDILWEIFTAISVDEQVSVYERLWTIITSSHVCQAWRNLIVNGASIWGRLVVVDCEHGETEKSLLIEIIRRSGTAPVWIESTALSTKTGVAKKEQLAEILNGLWKRIERMRIFGLEARDVKLFAQPAPMLERAHVEANLRGHLSNTPGATLFSNVAPKLRFLSSNFLTFPIYAPWLSHLTSLETGPETSFTATSLETLEILAHMPRLQSLALGHTVKADINGMDAISTYPLVNLGSLTYMAIVSDDLTCLTLVDRIRWSALGCLVNFNATITTSESLPSPNIVVFSLFNRLLAENVRLLDASGTLDWICLNIQLTSIAIASHGCRNYRHRSEIVQYPKMSPRGLFMGFQADDVHVHQSLVSVVDSLSKCTPLQDISTIRVIWEGRHLPIYYPCLSNFTSVTTLEASIDTIKRLYRFGSTRNPPASPIFPKLLKIRLHSKQDAYHRLAVLRDFLGRRSTLETRVAIIEIIRTVNIYEMAEELSCVAGLQKIIGGNRDGDTVQLDVIEYLVYRDLVEI